MRLLLFQAQHFEYRAAQRGSPLGAETPQPENERIEHALIAFLQMEPIDEQRPEALLNQAVKYFRWYTRKRQLTRILLHSFAHLAEERSSPEFALDFFNKLEDKLQQHQLEVSQTPFGWSLEWDLKVEGHAFAKTFKVL